MNETPEVMIDADKTAALHAKLAEMGVPQKEAELIASGGASASGVNWDDYDIEPAHRRFYDKAVRETTPDGEHWVYEHEEYRTVCRPFNAVDTTKDGKPQWGKDGMPRSLGGYITQMELAGWNMIQVLPSGTGFGAALFSRTVKAILPDPQKLATETEVTPLTDTELNEYASKAEGWASGQ